MGRSHRACRAILVAQKGVIESSETEAKLVEVEKKIADLLNQGVAGNIVKFHKSGPFDNDGGTEKDGWRLTMPGKDAGKISPESIP